ncbi:hypothetical protein [Acinetobacter sp.]|uniref:hypothetical protein n=2 Tax=unclassified Acinetobacter TaxID=196816 RepID=UPI0028A03DCD|nr:hypothetical protein [Acinetobacter sp.]
MQFNKKNILSLLIYILSVAAFTLTDFFVISFDDNNIIADWAFYKSSIFIVGSICILGFDQLLLRNINSYSVLKKQFLVQSFIISLIIICVFYYFQTFEKSIYMGVIGFTYSYLMFQAGFYRANGNLTQSQIRTNFWKIIFLAFLVFFYFFNFNLNLPLLLTLSMLFVVFLDIFSKNNIYLQNQSNSNDFKMNTIVGFYLFLHSFSLVIANYGEQFLINIYNKKEISSLIFTYNTVFNSVVLAVIAFIGFALGPKVRNDKNFNKKKYIKYMLIILLIAIFISLINSIAVYAFYDYMPFIFVFKKELYILILLLSLLKSIYIMPSLCLGIYGTNNSLKKSSIISLILALIYVICFLFLLKYNFRYLVQGLLLVMLLQWIGKIFISNYYVMKELDKK